MHYQKPFLAGILLLLTSLFACDSNEIGESKDVNQDKIYMDYDISYAEGDDQVIINLQYRFAGSAGTTLVLNKPSLVKLDGETLKVDSSAGGGAYYEVSKNYSAFLGKHLIQFTDVNGKQFENSFEFTPFAAANLPASAGSNKDLTITYNTAPLGKNDYLALTSVDTDSSFHYQQDGASSITIPANELKRQKDKQVSFETMLYREIPLSQTTSEGGKLKVTYRLKPAKINLLP